MLLYRGSKKDIHKLCNCCMMMRWAGQVCCLCYVLLRHVKSVMIPPVTALSDSEPESHPVIGVAAKSASSKRSQLDTKKTPTNQGVISELSDSSSEHLHGAAGRNKRRRGVEAVRPEQTQQSFRQQMERSCLCAKHCLKWFSADGFRDALEYRNLFSQMHKLDQDRFVTRLHMFAFVFCFCTLSDFSNHYQNNNSINFLALHHDINVFAQKQY
jgi:hypothetical protein